MRALLLTGVLLLLTGMLSGCQTAGTTQAPAKEASLALPDTIDVTTARGLQGKPDVVLIDVREPSEYDAGYLEGAKLIPLGEVPARINEIPKDKTVILTCRSGNRSGQAATFLRRQGYTNVHNMAGGIVAWQQANLPLER